MEPVFLGVSAPIGIALGPDDAVYVSSYTTSQVVRYSRDGVRLGVAVNGGVVRGPAGLRFGPSAELLVTSYDNHRVFLYNATVSTTAATPLELHMTVSVSDAKKRRLIR